MTGFVGNSWTLMLFFRYCRRYNITEKQAKLQVLGRIAKKGKIKYVRDVRPLLEGKKVLRITNKKDNHAN